MFGKVWFAFVCCMSWGNRRSDIIIGEVGFIILKEITKFFKHNKILRSTNNNQYLCVFRTNTVKCVCACV